MSLGIKKGLSNAVYDTGETESYFIEAGAGSLADGTGTGSTSAVSFTNSFSPAPVVTSSLHLASAHVGSTAMLVAGHTTGSAVFMGPSGAGFTWIAYGKK